MGAIMTNPHSQYLAVPLSVRVPPEVRDELEALADATGRTKSFLAAEAIRTYLLAQTWQVKAIERAVKKADSKKARFIDHDKVSDWLMSWGDQSERKKPE